MVHLLIVILDDLRCLPDLLQAWRDAGLPGVTIMESAGGYRTESWLSRVGLGAIDRLFEAEEIRRRTLMAVIEDGELLARAIAEAERVVGGFDRPNSGLLMVLPVADVRGLKKTLPRAAPEPLPPPVQPEWVVRRDMPVERVVAILNLEPTIVSPDLPLDQVAAIMLEHPYAHVACVVAEDGRLVGLLSLQDLVDDLLFHIMPEEFLSEVTDLERVMEYASRSRVKIVADAMREPVWVKKGEPVKLAFKRMHEHHLSGLPVVDEQYRVLGYINLLELLAICTECVSGPEAGQEARP
ncbi:MAG: CBS domain-containing protein [Anaerolineae bacterium]